MDPRFREDDELKLSAIGVKASAWLGFVIPAQAGTQ